MRLHRDNGSDEPCRHMESHLNRVADGTAYGLGLWFTLRHLAWCPQCRRFLESLKATIAKLREAKREPSQDAVDRILASYRAAVATPRAPD